MHGIYAEARLAGAVAVDGAIDAVFTDEAAVISCRELASTVEVEVCLLSMLIDCVVTTTAVVDRTVDVTSDVEVVSRLSNLVDVVVIVFKLELL